jgi:hypothetical protein
VVERVIVSTLVALAGPRLRVVIIRACSGGGTRAALGVGGLTLLELELLLLGLRAGLGARASRNVGCLAIGVPATARDNGVIEADGVA